MLQPTRITVVRGSSVYIAASVQDSDSNVDPTTLPVQIAVHAGPAEDATYLPAQWVDGVARTNSPVAFTGSDYAGQEYSVTVKVTSGAETELIRAGKISLTS